MNDSSRRRALSLALLASAWLLSARVHTTMVRMPMAFAPRLPVRVFPSIWVAAGKFDEDERIADRLAAHLAQDAQSEVRRVELSDLEPARVAGRIPVSTAVVIVSLELREGLQQYWDTMPMQNCSYYYGCTTANRSFVSTIPQVTGVVTLTVHEGPTSRVLQTEHVGRSVTGNEPEGARLQLVEQLASDVEQLVDTFRVTERVILVRAPVPEVEEAIARIEAGNWVEGRRLLEHAKSSLGGMNKKHQAQIWYDLGLARRFAPGESGLDEAAFQSAQRALHWAMGLDPHREYERALITLQRHYESEVALREQERARQHNFLLQTATSPGVPAELPPASAPSLEAPAPQPASSP